MAAGLLTPIGWLISGAPSPLDVPALRGFNFAGGLSISPEFTALLIGLSTYTAAFIAEVVRAGIQAVDGGQSEAAKARTTTEFLQRLLGEAYPSVALGDAFSDQVCAVMVEPIQGEAGVFVATSNGNAGPGAATTGSPASVPWLTSVGCGPSTWSLCSRGRTR